MYCLDKTQILHAKYAARVFHVSHTVLHTAGQCVQENTWN
jgi:hypothetical protein